MGLLCATVHWLIPIAESCHIPHIQVPKKHNAGEVDVLSRLATEMAYPYGYLRDLGTCRACGARELRKLGPYQPTGSDVHMELGWTRRMKDYECGLGFTNTKFKSNTNARDISCLALAGP